MAWEGDKQSNKRTDIATTRPKQPKGRFGENFRSPALKVWEWLKSDMREVTVLIIDKLGGRKGQKGGVRGPQRISKSIIYPPGKYKTIWFVSKFSIISKST